MAHFKTANQAFTPRGTTPRQIIMNLQLMRAKKVGQLRNLAWEKERLEKQTQIENLELYELDKELEKRMKDLQIIDEDLDFMDKNRPRVG